MGPPGPEYYDEGEYWQDSSAPGCTGNRAPDWRDLSWNADVYPEHHGHLQRVHRASSRRISRPARRTRSPR